MPAAGLGCLTGGAYQPEMLPAKWPRYKAVCFRRKVKQRSFCKNYRKPFQIRRARYDIVSTWQLFIFTLQMGAIKWLTFNLFTPRNWKMDSLDQNYGRNIRILKINRIGMLTLESLQVWHGRMKIRFSILNHQMGSLLMFLSAEGLESETLE